MNERHRLFILYKINVLYEFYQDKFIFQVNFSYFSSADGSQCESKVVWLSTKKPSVVPHAFANHITQPTRLFATFSREMGELGGMHR